VPAVAMCQAFGRACVNGGEDVTREEGCPLCVPQPQEMVIAATDSCLAVWNEHEPPEGGALIIPMAHRETVFSLTEREWLDTRILLDTVRDRIDERASPDGFNVGWNVGSVGGQSIPHAHLHIVPRWSDEPYAGRGLRWWIKSPENRRPE
jgi:diadenosine tetraphosphate (Ap4A) HIT family hydrolase